MYRLCCPLANEFAPTVDRSPGLTAVYSHRSRAAHANMHTDGARNFIVICKIALLASLLHLTERGPLRVG